jgi:hypothetical protein
VPSASRVEGSGPGIDKVPAPASLDSCSLHGRYAVRGVAT